MGVIWSRFELKGSFGNEILGCLMLNRFDRYNHVKWYFRLVLANELACQPRIFRELRTCNANTPRPFCRQLSLLRHHEIIPVHMLRGVLNVLAVHIRRTHPRVLCLTCGCTASFSWRSPSQWGTIQYLSFKPSLMIGVGSNGTHHQSSSCHLCGTTGRLFSQQL